MRFSKVLLVHPETPSKVIGVRPPASLGYVAQSLSEIAIEYDIFDMQLGYSQRELLRKIDVFKPDLIGFSLLSLGYKRSYDLIERIDITIEPEIICTSNVYGCEDFDTQAEAQEVLEYCRTEKVKDIHYLDIDSDGIACETLP